MTTPRSLVLLVLLVAGVTGAGCGGSASPEDQVRGVVTDYGKAVDKHDYQRICDELIAKRLSDSVEEIGLPCELAFKKGLAAVRAPRLTIRAVRVNGTTAFATVHTTAAGQPPSDDTLKLALADGRWRIVSLSAAASATSGTQTQPAPATAPPGAIPAG